MEGYKSLVFVGVGTFAVGAVFGIYILYKRKNRRKDETICRSAFPPPPQLYDPARTHIITHADEWESLYTQLTDDILKYKVLGFDCEWVTTINSTNGRHCSRPVALLQLSTPSQTVALIRLSHMQSLPPSLEKLLQDKSVLKVGVASVDDGNKLYRDHGLVVRGCVDLRYVAVRARLSTSGGFGLADLTSNVLGFKLKKTQSVRCSDWEEDQLSEKQVEYAALDALVATEIFLRLVETKINSIHHRRGCTTNNNGSTRETDSSDVLWQAAVSICQGVVDVNFSGKTSKKINSSSTNSASLKRSDKPAGRSYLSRQKPLYHNCQLRAPDGQLLCTCDIRKAQWYIEKGLGEKIHDDPLTVQLKFEPSGRPLDQNNYYMQDKVNLCVVCGRNDSYIRKNIVPHEYRKFFPSLMKNHRSHDVVLLCTRCHQLSGLHDSLFKERLSVKCGAPIRSDNSVKFTHDPHLSQIRSACKALLLNGHKLPAARKAELTEIVQLYYGVDSLADDLLKEGIELDTKVPNEDYTPYGKQVVDYVMQDEGLVEFEKSWRKHFLETMKPQYLPPLWSVDHSHSELTDLNSEIKQSLHLTTSSSSNGTA